MRIRQRIAHDAIAMAERATHTQTTRATRERSFEIDCALSKLRTGSGEMRRRALAPWPWSEEALRDSAMRVCVRSMAISAEMRELNHS